jgi:hypothetical protein
MSERVRPLVAGCPTEPAHRFDIPLGEHGSVTGLSLHCASCAGPDRPAPADELAEMLAARRMTLTGLSRLPARIRAELDAAGTLARLYQGTLAEVREAVDRCRTASGGEPPALPAGARAVDPGQVTALLDAVADWAARLRPSPTA